MTRESTNLESKLNQKVRRVVLLLFKMVSQNIYQNTVSSHGLVVRIPYLRVVSCGYESQKEPMSETKSPC